MKQRTLKKYYTFEGKGLHTGRYAHMTLKPAAPGTRNLVLCSFSFVRNKS